MANISFHSEEVAVPGLDPEFLCLWISYIAKECGRTVGPLSYIFCSDDYILNVNRQYLKHDYYTDIITFDYSEGDVISGDIYISIDTVNANAEKYADGDFDDELKRVMIHGVLHLCGFNDKTSKEQVIMTNKENWALKEMTRFT